MVILRRALGLGLLLLCGGCASAPTSKSQPIAPRVDRVAFLHANVLPMDTERVLSDQTVVVEGRTIVALGPSAQVKVPAGARRIDARGRYLLPALCDMHVHLLGQAWNQALPPAEQYAGPELPQASFLFPYLASGVTTVQSLAATPEEITLRGRIEHGELLGPRLILAPLIDGPKKAWPPPISTWVATPAEARAAVLRAKEAGFDKIKVYSFLDKDSYDAIVAAAKEVHMDVIGHVPMSLSVEYVLDSGQKMIAHTEEILKHTHGDFSPERIDYYADLLAKRGVWIIPTLVTTHIFIDFFADPNSPYAGPEAAYFAHPLQRELWSFLAKNLYGPIPEAGRNSIREGFEKFQRPLTKALRDKGAKMMIGSDALMLGVHAGVSLHGELRELVGVGLTPYEALRTSTTTPFEYLGESDRAGTIAVGRQSDLLLVDENPLADITAASKIAGVLVRGRWIARDEIDRRMREIAASYAVPGTAAPKGR